MTAEPWHPPVTDAPAAATVRRLPRRLQRAERRPQLPTDASFAGESAPPLFQTTAGAHVAGGLRATRRLAAVLGLTAVGIPAQAACLAMPGRLWVGTAAFYWTGVTRSLGLRVRVIGKRAEPGPRPVIFVANHTSWLDIPVLGSTLSACFIAKSEVGSWPLIGLIARLGRTVFISRSPRATRRESEEMRRRLAHGDDLILFPEGTTSDGSRVMPFRSAFFAIVEPAEGVAAPIIQPVSVAYDRLAGLPAGRTTRPLFAWYGDMDLASHFWRLGRYRGLRVTVLLHPPVDPAAFPNRKALAHAVWRVVADGASQLRQNRPARPLSASAP